jgi:hypothetical protein
VARTLSHTPWPGAERTQNISQLPGFGDPPSTPEHFSTTANGAYNCIGGTPAATPRHGATFKGKNEATSDIFGTRTARKTRPETTSEAMMAQTRHVERKRNPRLVHGGDFRYRSVIALDKNLGGPPTDYTTTTGMVVGWPGTGERPTHRFELPQKNVSTYLTTSLGVGAGHALGHSPRARMADFPTAADAYRTPSQTTYRSSALAGSAHFSTSHATHYAKPGGKLVVPLGKGGVDMTVSVVPLFEGTEGGPSNTTPHSASIFTGAQPPDGIRAACASRGTLGARGGLKLVR